MIEQAYQYCETYCREQDRDRYLATLFASANLRQHLFALYAFDIEIASIRDRAKDPMPGEIRLQWWRDALSGVAQGDASAHPLALALMETIETCQLPKEPLLNMCDARIFDLYDDPMPTMHDFEGYIGETSAAIIRLACLILAQGGDAGKPEAAAHAGLANALCAHLRAMPYVAARGQVFIPLDILSKHGSSPAEITSGTYTPALKRALDEMRQRAWRHVEELRQDMEGLPTEVMPAFLPVCLVRPQLSRMEKSNYDPFLKPVELSPWRKQWALWCAAKRAGCR
jgi:15-cis-phytoene synthase